MGKRASPRQVTTQPTFSLLSPQVPHLPRTGHIVTSYIRRLRFPPLPLRSGFLVTPDVPSERTSAVEWTLRSLIAQMPPLHCSHAVLPTRARDIRLPVGTVRVHENLHGGSSTAPVDGPAPFRRYAGLNGHTRILREVQR